MGLLAYAIVGWCCMAKQDTFMLNVCNCRMLAVRMTVVPRALQVACIPLTAKLITVGLPVRTSPIPFLSAQKIVKKSLRLDREMLLILSSVLHLLLTSGKSCVSNKAVAIECDLMRAGIDLAANGLQTACCQ